MTAERALRDRISVVVGDITHLEVDAIVNAANESLQGGGGVDGAIHRAAGPGLLEECRSVAPCPTGEARLTRGHALPARYVVHTVGPVWRGGREREPELLAAAYESSLTIARDEGLHSIAFPAISTGVYGFPLEPATAIAVSTVANFLRNNSIPDRVVFVCFSEAAEAVYDAKLAAHVTDPG